MLDFALPPCFEQQCRISIASYFVLDAIRSFVAMLWIILFVISQFWILSEGQAINGNQTENEIVQSCKCMPYWRCIEEKGIVYSSCGLANICCLPFGKNLDDELFPLTTPGLLKKRLPSNTIKPKKKPKKVLRSRDFDDILNNQLTNQSRTSRRRPTLSTNKSQNSLFCGRRGDKGELYHWHADILEKKQNLYICGGSLIANQYILTASHCFINLRNASDLKVRLGDYDISRDDETEWPYQEVSVKRIIMHPKFSPATLNNDIAILQLSKPVKTNPIIQKVCLPTAEMLRSVSKNLEKLDCVVIGHGKLNEMPLWKHTRCEASLRRLFGTNDLPSMDSILCAGSRFKDACIGDGGSSLTCSVKDSKTYYQLGVVSFGPCCGCSNNVPGVYSSLLGDKIEWIRSILK